MHGKAADRCPEFGLDQNTITSLRYDMWDQGELNDGPMPRWAQIADRLRAAIAAGEFRPGDYLPSETVLNETFGVSRTTSRASLDKLEQEGLIERRSGKGSRVLAPEHVQPISRIAGFAEDMRGTGREPSYRTLAAGFAAAPREAAGELGVASGTRVFTIRRILKADGWPIGLQHSWLAPGILDGHTPPTRADLDRASLYAFLEQQCGVRFCGGHQHIEAAAADASLAGQLKVEPGTPILLIRRLSAGPNGDPIEFVALRFRGDLYRFRADFGRSGPLALDAAPNDTKG